MHSRPAIIATLLFVAAIAVSATISLLRPPVPRVHDEFSYLLAADTFNHGRMANPTHPLWRHFETIHVIQQPSYASKYPPGQGAMLALGQWATGWPMAGVWLTTALAVVACYWMLLGMVPPKWATAGAGLLILVPGMQLVWGQTYWGGMLAYAGGAFVLGAAARLRTQLNVSAAALMAAGALILAVSRPFEGLVVCLMAAGWVVTTWLLNGWPNTLALLGRVIAPQLAILTLGAVALASYNYAVTGSPTTMPYQVHESTYGMCPLFLWQEPVLDRTYAHDSLAKFHGEWSMEWLHRQQTFAGLMSTKWELLKFAAMVFLPLPLVLPLVVMPMWRGRKLRGPLLMLGLVWLITQITIWNWPHYIAPIAPLLMLTLVYGLRNLTVFARSRDWNFSPLRWIAVAQVLCFASAVWTHVNAPIAGWEHQRSAMLKHLVEQPGDDLVLVEYTPLHHPHLEWVYNGADLENADVVWAHSMSAAENAELVDYYAGRNVWRLAADMNPPRLRKVEQPEGAQLAKAANVAPVAPVANVAPCD